MRRSTLLKILNVLFYVSFVPMCTLLLYAQFVWSPAYNKARIAENTKLWQENYPNKPATVIEGLSALVDMNTKINSEADYTVEYHQEDHLQAPDVLGFDWHIEKDYQFFKCTSYPSLEDSLPEIFIYLYHGSNVINKLVINEWYVLGSKYISVLDIDDIRIVTTVDPDCDNKNVEVKVTSLAYDLNLTESYVAYMLNNNLQNPLNLAEAVNLVGALEDRTIIRMLEEDDSGLVDNVDTSTHDLEWWPVSVVQNSDNWCNKSFPDGTLMQPTVWIHLVSESDIVDTYTVQAPWETSTDSNGTLFSKTLDYGSTTLEVLTYIKNDCTEQSAQVLLVSKE